MDILTTLISLFSTYGRWVFLAFYVAYAVLSTNKGKPLSWMLAHLGVIAAGGLAAAAQFNFYLIGGAVAAVGTVVQQLATGKFTAGNVLAALKLVGSNLLFYPVSLFEQMYAAITKQTPVK